MKEITSEELRKWPKDSHEQELNFSNSIDQTELRKFAKSLYHDLCEV